MTCNRILGKILVGLILIALLATAAFVTAFLFYFPHVVEGQFGQADSSLDTSQSVLLSLYLYFNGDSLNIPLSNEHQGRIFIIELGDSASVISNNLFQEGFISNAELFTRYLRFRGIDKKLQAGVYFLSPASTPIEIADAIHDTDPASVKFSFLVGWRAEEVARLIPSSGLGFSKSNFLDIIKNPPDKLVKTLPFQPSSLEGLLHPGSYSLLRESSELDVVTELVHTFFNQLPPDYEARIEGLGLTLYDAIILASIIQKEAVNLNEAPMIASVFINRLKIDMPLQSDPTVQYALGFIEEQQSWWKNPLSREDLRVDSPFNTYLYNGLPPTPICSPGLEALLAVAYPAESDYYFFRAACDGSGLHIFSQTYEEHLAAAC